MLQGLLPVEGRKRTHGHPEKEGAEKQKSSKVSNTQIEIRSKEQDDKVTHQKLTNLYSIPETKLT